MLLRDISKMTRFRKFESEKDGDTNQKKVVITKLLSGKMDFSAKGITRNNEWLQNNVGLVYQHDMEI